MDLPYTTISGHSSREVDPAAVYLHVSSEYIDIDEAALAQALQQWLLDNVPDIVATTAERREVIYPITQLPALP